MNTSFWLGNLGGYFGQERTIYRNQSFVQLNARWFDSMVHTTILFLALSYFTTFASTVSTQGSEGGSVFDSITKTVSSWISDFGYPAVFLVALLENLFPPIPSEVVFPLVGFVAYHNNLGIAHAISMGIVGALGSTAGAVVIYCVSLKIGRPAILRFGRYVRIGEKGLLEAESWFQKYGAIAVFSGRMAPAIRELISIPAGLGEMNIVKFVLFTFAGSAVWSVALTLLGFFLGDAWSLLADQLFSVFSVIAIIIIMTIIVIVGLMYYKRRHEKGNIANSSRRGSK
jgi:membrane protein DedA with SNARE-associated domain